jgi:WD40 repeat protein
MRKLAFAADGAILLHSKTSNTVAVWSVPHRRLESIHPGILIGVSRDGRSFLTHHQEGFSAWTIPTGLPLALRNLNPGSFKLNQRCLVSGDMFGMTLRIQDALDPSPPRVYRVPHSPSYLTEAGTYGIISWAIAPSDRCILVTVSGEGGGHEWALGQCIDIATGTQRYEFDVNHFLFKPSFNFSGEHGLFVMGSDSRNLKMYNTSTGRIIRKFRADSYVGLAAVSPKDKWLVALEVYVYSKESQTRSFNIHLIDVQERGRPNAILVINEPRPVEDLLFLLDRRYLASVLSDDTVHLRNVATGELANVLSYG